MSKYPGFDAELFIGTQQTWYATIVIDAPAPFEITAAGNAEFITTHSLVAGTPLTTDVALVIGDLTADVARKAAIALNAIPAIAEDLVYYAVGHLLYARCVEAAANEGAMKIGFQDAGTCEGLTDELTGLQGVTGVAEVEVANVTNISGPGLAVDTEDVTTHDQTTAFEEHVATIIRSGEVTLDIVYDPAHATHDAGTGLIFRMETKLYSFFKLIFSNDTEWEFSGYVTGFEPGMPVGGALTASVKIKIANQPLLA